MVVAVVVQKITHLLQAQVHLVKVLQVVMVQLAQELQQPEQVAVVVEQVQLAQQVY
jgi:hypothetical protein